MTQTRGPTKKQTKRAIEQDLRNQLISLGIFGKYNDNLIDDYMYLYDLKNKLIKDIKKNGIRVKTTNGNGFEIEKDNSSIVNLLKVNTQMLKILSDLNLKDPSSQPLSQEKLIKDDLLSRD